ncbi:MAG: SUMF1/EgtB/PvdO family nonheme iron enzyme [Planctomycetota bacterium]
MLTGKYPFSGDNVKKLAHSICYKNPRPPRQINELTPRQLERICLKCMQRILEDRYQSMADLLDDLNGYQKELEDAALASQTPKSRLGNTDVEPEAETVRSNDSTGSVSRRGANSGSRSHTSDWRSQKIGIIEEFVPKGLRAFDQNDSEFFPALLPGAKDRLGLPDSLRFWLARLGGEEDLDQIPVGVIYGPSGCGKSSFVRAGLIPRLPENIVPVYIDCTTKDLDQKVATKIRQEINSIPADQPLAQTFREIRRGSYLRGGDKLLLILDQFEQWLSTSPNLIEDPLTESLRQCDSNHVQAIVLIRDEFWMSVSELLRCLDQRLSATNSMALPLFDKRHAQHVLIAMGRANRSLPAAESGLTRSQKGFIKAAVDSISERGKVTCIHLVVLAETLKNRDWNYTEFKSLGGWDGIGREYLADVFNNPETPTFIKRHELQVWQILKPLLPVVGSDLKGLTVSPNELQTRSGLEGSNRLFETLLQFLENESGLISKVETSSLDDTTDSDQQAELKYGLTHDFLVKPIRNWGNAKENQTAQGRADSKIANLAVQWKATKDDRFLVSARDYFGLLPFASSGIKNEYPEFWTRSSRRALARITFLTLGLLIFSIVATWFWGQYANKQRTIVLNQYLDGSTETLRENGFQIETFLPDLTNEFESKLESKNARHRFRSALALDSISKDENQMIVKVFNELDEVKIDDLKLLLYWAKKRDLQYVDAIRKMTFDNELIEHRATILAAILGDKVRFRQICQFGPDPGPRYRLVEELKNWKFASKTLFVQFDDGENKGLANCLATFIKGLSLNEFEAFETEELDDLKRNLTDIYCNHPAAFVHSSALHLMTKLQFEIPRIDSFSKKNQWVELNLESEQSPGVFHKILLARIPSGSFKIGSGLQREYEISLKKYLTGEVTQSFYISAFETSNSLFRESKLSPRVDSKVTSRSFDPPIENSFDQKIVPFVDQFQATKFCQWLTRFARAELEELEKVLELEKDEQLIFALPNTDQFELANRVESETSYFFGSDIKKRNLFAGQKGLFSNQVPPNGFGIFDLGGNLMEWTNHRSISLFSGERNGRGIARGGTDEGSDQELCSGIQNDRPLMGVFGKYTLRPVLLKVHRNTNEPSQEEKP